MRNLALMWVLAACLLGCGGRENKNIFQPDVSSNPDSIAMVFVNGGSFPRMGVAGLGIRWTIGGARDFYMGKYEVTQGLWKAVMGGTPSEFAWDNNLPVERVSCEEAIDFIGRLNAKTGKKYRLPTVEEWEYTFRCGDTTKEYMLSYSNDDENIGGKPYPVGMKQPNEWGIYDINGNVIEWTVDPDVYWDIAFPVLSDGAWDYSRLCDTGRRISSNFILGDIDYKHPKENGYERMGFRLAHDSPITKPAWMYFSKVENPIKEKQK